MSSPRVSSFHSSSECSTARVTRRNPDTDEIDSNLYSATSSRPKASATGNESFTTPFESDAFASPVSRPPTAASTSLTPTPATARLGQRLGGSRPPGIAVLSPASLSQSFASARTSSVGITLPPPPGILVSPNTSIKADFAAPTSDQKLFTPSAGPNQSTSSPNTSTHKLRNLLSVLRVASAPVPAEPNASSSDPLASTSNPLQATPKVAAGAAPRRALLSPTVPITRAAAGEGRTAAGTTARQRPPLPPLRPPSSFFTIGSKSPSRNGSSRPVSPTSQHDEGAPAPINAGANAPSLPLAAVRVQAAHDGGWWAAARRYAASKSDQVNIYLERLVNPGAVNLATANAQTAAAQARSRRASQLRQAHSNNVSFSGGSARHSRTASNSSGFEGAFDTDRRAPPAHPPPSPARRSLYEPFGSVARQDSGVDTDAMPLDVVVIDPAQEPYVWNDPSIQAPEVRVESRDAANDSFNGVGDVSESDPDGADGEPNTYVVDLLSALRGYLTTPTEPFGHLVAAALASRSAEMPVRGFEIAAAEHNPFLVRTIVDSGTLEVQDEEVQRNVQDTVDELIPATEGELSPGIYEYLSSFFKLPFVRLSHGQYALLKRSGFEYIKLIFDHQHVLPDEPFHSILINESRVMHLFNLVFMVIQLLSIIFCTVTIALVLASWMKMDNNKLQSYGFYTLIVFGGGWALYLIFIIYAVRSRQDEQRYEPPEKASDRLLLPSPYVSVVPVIPLFDILCLVKYIIAVRKGRMIHGHNIVASSRLSGAFYAVWFAFPQFITQSYFNNIELSIESRYRHRWAYTMLMVAVICQWGIALFGYVSFLFTRDSIDGFGFACFNMARVPHLLERHNAAAHTLHYLMAFLLEANVYLLAASGINRPIPETCASYWNVVLALSAFSVFYIIIVYLAITLTEATAVRISFTSVALIAVQVTLCVCSERVERDECAMYRHFFFRGAFVFGYLAWGAYFLIFLVWLLMMIQWYVLYTRQLNLFPRVLWPYARRDERFRKAKKLESSSTEPDGSVDGAGESKEDAHTA